MNIANEKWTKVPLVGVTMNPVRGPNLFHYGFVDLAIVLRQPDGSTETVVDCRTRARDNPNQIGEFTAEEMERFHLHGFEYTQGARPVAPILASLASFTRGALPIAVNEQLCKKLLCNAARLADGSGTFVDNTGVFLLREKSRWIDLGLWRFNAAERGVAGAERFGGLSLAPRARVEEVFARLPILAESLGVSPDWTVKQLLDWQGTLLPF